MSLLSIVGAKISTNEIGITDPITNENVAFLDLLNIIYFWAGIVAVIVIIVAAFYYVTSAGRAEKVKQAKNAILGAVVGLVVILMAFSITQFVLGHIDSSTNTPANQQPANCQGNQPCAN